MAPIYIENCILVLKQVGLTARIVLILCGIYSKTLLYINLLFRCPEYEDVDETCDFLPDPKDPSCCVMPKCPNKGSTPGPTQLPLPASTGSFIGQGTGTG